MEFAKCFSLNAQFLDLENDFRILKGKTICILGASGLFGNWLSETILRISDEYQLDLKIIGVSRNPIQNYFVKGHKNFTNFLMDIVHTYDELPFFDFCFHAATSNDQIDFPEKMNSAVKGAELIIKSSEKYKNNPLVIHLSSGAVYQSNLNFNGYFPEIGIEELCGNGTQYGRAKLETEKLLNEAHDLNLITACNPRLFAFMGPGIPLDKHFAIGNFMRAAVNNSSIEITGNSKTTRSYMFLPDAIKCLVTLLVRPIYTPLNIGSPQSITIGNLALEISTLFQLPTPHLKEGNSDVSHYVPITPQVSKLLGRTQPTNLEQGLQRWFNWLTS